jgi:hypothetical protein
MKHLITLFVFLTIIFSFPARSQYKSNDGFEKNFVIKTNPLAALGSPFWILFIPITGEYKLIFETKTFTHQSAYIGASYLGPSLVFNIENLDLYDSTGQAYDNGIRVRGYRFQGGYKFYLTKEEAPKGFYLGPHIAYASAWILDKDEPSEYIKMTKLNVNALMGYQVITDGGFAFDVYTGLGVKNRLWTYTDNFYSSEDLWPSTTTMSVTLGFSFGYAF